MKIIVVITVLFLSQFLLSQNSVTKNLDDFKKVTSFDQIDVQLIIAEENKIIINGKDASEVEVVNKNGELKIKMPFDKLLKGDNISVILFCNNINAVEANEGSRIASESIFKTNNFNIIAKEGSQIKINIEVNNLQAKVSDGSIVDLTGNSTSQDILVFAGGIYNAKKLISNKTIITANAGGEANIYSKEFVDAKVRAGGIILIYGKPKEIIQKVIAGGTIKENE
jgi:hypothetical protein